MGTAGARDCPERRLRPAFRPREALNNSLASRASLLRAVCGVANPRHSYGYGCGLRLAAHPASRRATSRGVIQRFPRVFARGGAPTTDAESRTVRSSRTEASDAPARPSAGEDIA